MMARLAVAAVAVLVSAAGWASPSLITPTPKQMELTGEVVPLAGASVILTGEEPKLRAGAEEINHRLTVELDADALPITAGGREQVEAAQGPAIVIGVSGQGAMAEVERAFPVAVPEKAEGYGIAPHGSRAKRVLVLAGHDAQGALYAAVTLRYLIGSEGMHVATVRDWPDFRWRQCGNVSVPHSRKYWGLNDALRKGDAERAGEFGEQYVREAQQYIDILVRHKVNLSEGHSPSFLTQPEMRKWARRINDYGAARGVDFMTMGSTSIGTYPADKDDPDISRCVDYRTHNRYFCWSLLEAHEKKTSRYAEAMEEAGFRWLYMHATDGGGWENPAKWNDRCDHCRAMYGDDHAAADARVFGMYYEKIKSRIPDFKMVAVVYPYNGDYLNPDVIEQRIMAASGPIPNARAIADTAAKQHQDFLTRLGRLLPADIKICQREVPPESYALMEKCYGDRDFQIYMEFEGSRQRWQPEFSMAVGWARTYFRPDHEDVFFPRHSQWGFNIMSELLATEFAWNGNAPGAANYPGGAVRLLGIDHHNQPLPLAREYLRRLCTDFWGPVVGPHMVAVFDSNISYRFIQRPDVVAEEMGLTDVPERMQQMTEATTRSMEAMEQARAAYEAARAEGREPITDPVARRLFGDYWRACLAARCVAAFRAAMLGARAAAIEGRFEDARALEAQARVIVQREQAAWEERRDWLDSVPYTDGINPRYVYTFGQFSRFDYSALTQELDEFVANRDALFEAYNAPPWFEEAMATRALYAVPADTPPTIDGKLQEDVWQAAPHNEYFVDYESSTLAAKETFAQALYDAEALYVGFTVFEPNADGIDVPKRDAHGFNRDHSVEIFVDANADRESYLHFIWDPAGSELAERVARNAEGRVDQERGVETGAEYRVASYADRWTLEARIPSEDLGRAPAAGQTWRANLCRNLLKPNGDTESVSTVLLEGSTFHTPEKFAELRLLPHMPAQPDPLVSLRIEEKRAGQTTIGTGVGYEVALGLALETTKPLHNVSLGAGIYSGDERKGELQVFEGQDVRLLWRTRRDLRHVVETPEPGLEYVFRVRADEGEWSFRRVFGTPPLRTHEPQFVAGVSGQALQGSAHFPAVVGAARLFDSRQGTLEMWVKPRPPLTPALRFGPDPSHAFFHQGPVRFDHPHLDNWRSVCVKRTRNRLSARLSTDAWQQLSTGASLAEWEGGEWHHVAAQWSAVDGRALQLEVYLDGKRTSRDAESTFHDRAWKKELEDLPVQLGGMVTGACPLVWPIDEVRVSSVPRYAADFAPEKRATTDEQTTLVFHFDGDLAGETAQAATVSAVAGPAR